VERFQLVWYDSRGSGLSDREAIDFSMNAMVRDVEAVVESAGLTRFAMSAVGMAPIAVTYAAIRPEKISSLVLVDGWTKYSDYHQNPAAIVAEEALRSGDWIVYTETVARVLSGIENQEFAARYATYIRECVEPEALRAAFSSMGNQDWDVSALLPRVSAHTLVVHNRNNRFLPLQAGQRLAARIPNARFQIVDDMDYKQLAGIIAGFLGESDQIAPRPFDHVPSGTAIIVFADIVDSTSRSASATPPSATKPAGWTRRCEGRSATTAGRRWKARRWATGCWRCLRRRNRRSLARGRVTRRRVRRDLRCTQGSTPVM
jgi:hypothetical protein